MKIYIYSEALFIRDAFIRKHRDPDGFYREQNQCFRNRTVVWGTKPCFTMTKGL